MFTSTSHQIKNKPSQKFQFTAFSAPHKRLKRTFMEGISELGTMHMKYKPTLLNICSVILIISSNYTYWNSGHQNDEEGWGGLALLIMIGAGLTGLLLDYKIQKSFPNYLMVNGIGLAIIITIWTIGNWNKREKIIVIPDNFKGYVTIVYNVSGEESLFLLPINFGYTVKMPETGILFTSTLESLDIWNTRFYTESGILLDHSSDTNTLHAHHYESGEFSCKGEAWKFKTWLVNNEAGYNRNVDIDSVTISAIKDYCDGLK